MDERDSLPFTVGEEISVTLLDEQKEPSHPATVRKVVGRTLGLMTPSPMPLRAGISIKRDDALFLGEVTYCERAKEGHLHVVELQEMLSGIADLQRNWISPGIVIPPAGIE
jgi:hypothetical protein